VFEPYFTTKQTGSGLGLATAYSVVKNHDGLITVESEPGQGTAFTIHLPAGENPGQGAPVRAKIRGQYSGRVLLMDDNEAIRELASEMLADMGFDVTTAPSGEEVITRYVEAKAASRSFDLCILDLTVPGGMGGLETLRRLKLIDPAVKAIVSSGYSNDPVMGGYRAYGFSGVVVKPYTPEQLAEVLSGILPVDQV
jgi:CheY-like chemotaxis protein